MLNGSAGAASLDAEVRVIQELKVGAHPSAIIPVVSLEFTEQAQDTYTRAFISCQKRTAADSNVFIYNRSPIIAPPHLSFGANSLSTRIHCLGAYCVLRFSADPFGDTRPQKARSLSVNLVQDWELVR